MTKELCSILKERLADMDFVDVLAGLAQPVIDTKFKEIEGVKIAKKMPVSYDVVGGKSMYLGMERELVPNKSKKSIIYFEDFGTNADTSATVGARFMALSSQIRIVCFLNKEKLHQYKYNEVTAHCQSEILKRLVSGAGFSGNGITRIFCNIRQIPIQDANIFSRYNYDEAELQYLRPPFEYFAIDLTVRYQVIKSCLTAINLS